jgi:N-glycosylase/DNA lyase
MVGGMTAAESGATHRIGLDRPLDLDNTLFSGQAFRWRRVGEWYRGVVFGNVVRIRQTDDGLEIAAQPDDAVELGPLLADYLGLDADLERIYDSISVDSRIREAVERYRGMRVLRQEPWECLMSFICTSASNIPRISQNIESICQAFGRPIPGGGREPMHAFPTPGELAGATEAEVRDLGLGYRAAYLVSTARTVAGGTVDLMNLREAPYEEALDALASLDGVGDKVANCVLLMSLDKPEAFPVDTHIDQRLREWYMDGSKLNRVKMRMWAQEYFGTHAGYANHYLFHDRRLQARGARQRPA